ncbi:MAG TPA: hypothetical protein VLA21_03270 [Candidatus Limnocylindria bacterium]|nr:hypothetical protein [Candidatus Limnocylindria bacterium]
MRKALAIVVAVVMAFVVLAATLNAFAHPAVPEQSLHNVSENACCGLRRAYAKVQCAGGVAAHVFWYRFCPNH